MRVEGATFTKGEAGWERVVVGLLHFLAREQGIGVDVMGKAGTMGHEIPSIFHGGLAVHSISERSIQNIYGLDGYSKTLSAISQSLQYVIQVSHSHYFPTSNAFGTQLP
jgi:hypothetical protein